jgi:hypothetical protein
VTSDPERPNPPCDRDDPDRDEERAAAIAGVLARAAALRRDDPDANVARFLEEELARRGDRALLGEAELRRGRPDAAVGHLLAAVAARPDDVARHHLLGIALRRLHRYDEAVAAFEAVLARDPAHAGARQALGALLTLWPARLAEGIAHLEAGLAAVQAAPDARPADARAALAGAYLLAGQWEAASALTGAALAAEPAHGYANFYQALLRLTLGDLANGFRQYEARWLVPTVDVPFTDPGLPEWTGQDLAGRRLLVVPDQGVGDVVHFARYLPLVRARGAEVVLQVPAALVRLMRTLPGITVVASDDPAPPCDVFVPIGSLPTRFGTTLQTIPATIPYLGVDAEASARWRAQLDAAGGSGPRVGVCWSGNPKYPLTHYRDIAPEALAPLAGVAARFCTVQPGITRPPPLPGLIDAGATLQDFADTAALIAALDLVVTVDTAVAHVAGALGKAVFLMVQRVPDWRWMLERSDSPWYPGMRLFRQSRDGEWSDVVAAVAAALG